MAEGRETVRYAVVGAGHIAQVAILPAFAHARENSALVAIVSSDEAKRRALAERYAIRHAGGYDDLERVLEEAAADAVYIALPNNQHREYTERAARLGVHVLCEKPMASTVEDGEAMIAAARNGGVKLMIAYRLHFEEANLRAIDLVQSGRIGEPRAFSAVMSHQVRPGDIRARGELGGGALLDEGPYPVNAARYLFRDEPLAACGYAVVGADERFPDVDQTACALLRFPGGRLAQLCVAQDAAGVSSYRIVGTEGDLLVEPAFSYATERRHRLTVGGQTEERTFPVQDQFAPEIVYFSGCILEGLDPEPDGQEGLADLRVLAAIAESARRGVSIDLPPFERRRRPNLDQLIIKPAIEPPETVHAPAPARH